MEILLEQFIFKNLYKLVILTLHESGNLQTLATPTHQLNLYIFSFFLDSKFLSSLLNHEEDLKEVCVRLDTAMAGVGDYRGVAQHYGFNHYQISSVLEKHTRGPSTALFEWLEASKPELTVRGFAAVVKEKAKRNDVVKVLLAYDSNDK